jgi:hypothetical protein
VVSDHRRLLPIADSQEMMVGITYAMPYEVRQFHLCNVCLHIDATADSNKEGCPLVTVSSKDSYGKMFIVLRAFLPNEQSWSYKWFFQTVLPALLGKDVLKKIKIIVTDGGSQAISQLDDAIGKFSLMPIGLGVLGILSTGDGIKRSKWLLEASHVRKGLSLASVNQDRKLPHSRS